MYVFSKDIREDIVITKIQITYAKFLVSSGERFNVWFRRKIVRSRFQCGADMCGLVERLYGVASSAVQICVVWSRDCTG